MDQPAEEHPAASDTSDRGLIIMLIVGGLIIMFFVLLAGVVGMTP